MICCLGAYFSSSWASVTKMFNLFIHSFAICPVLSGSQGGLKPIPAVSGHESRHIVERLPVYHRTDVQGQPYVLIFKPTGNLGSPLKVPCISLDRGREPGFPQEIYSHINMQISRCSAGVMFTRLCFCTC